MQGALLTALVLPDMAESHRPEYSSSIFLPVEQALPWMYQRARTTRPISFVRDLLGWLCARYDCTCGAVGTWRDEGFAGSQAVGFRPDVLERLNLRWSAIGRDQLEVQTSANKSLGRSIAQSTAERPHMRIGSLATALEFVSDSPEHRGVTIALDLPTWGRTALLLLERPPHHPWDATTVSDLERLTSNVPECVAVSHVLELACDNLPTSGRAVAIFDGLGSLLVVTTPFVELTSELNVHSNLQGEDVPLAWLAAARRGKSIALDSELLHLTFSAVADCWMVEARRSSALRQLSGREFEVATRYAQGLSHKEIARHLAIAPNTVRVHLQRIFAKAGVTSKQGLREWVANASVAAGAVPPKVVQASAA